MSVRVRLAELVDMALGTAGGGSPQLGALRILLRGLLQHLAPLEAPLLLGEGEGGLLEPPPASSAGEKPGSLPRQGRRGLGRPEGQPPSSAGQVVQLQKSLEVTEERMTKVMDTLQEMHNTICSLKTTVEGFQEELQLLKDNFQKDGLEELQEQSVQQDEHSHLLQSILDQLAEVQQELSSLPCNAAAPRRSSVSEEPAGEKLSSRDPSPEPLQEPAHEAPCKLSWLLEQYEAVGTHVSHQESQDAHLGTFEDTAARLEKVPSEMRQMKDGGEKGMDFSREVLEQVRQLQEQCTRLQGAAERLWGDTKDTQKAEKETKANREELQHAMTQLSEVMQDLLQRMSLQDQDRQKGLENLLSKIDSKAQLEQLWKLTQQCHCQGSCCTATYATGFKRQLFDPAKCISCDRPLTSAPAPPLVTVRRNRQLLQTHPACASASNCPAQRLPGRESKGSSRASRGPASPTGPLSRSSSLMTICPCGNPAGFASKNKEVDILGIDGIIYKGRLSSPPASKATTVGKDFPASKTPQPCSQHITEKTRRVSKYSSRYVSPYSCAATRRPASQGAGGKRTAGT
ncbi:uncharacterized protein C16orf96 homolog isoform X2 [Apus apus]|uniref:uncharacterized protein C16orf96 homolog isoform X2 n=1 Tax=Apus apus TaxID=8895 RepID=UPI0021F88DC3|nr:uncharacterized protein C16orf96 homolog isoform X2 [Apus apus]